MSDSNNKKFLKGAAVLAVAGIMIKVLGAVFRIPRNAGEGHHGKIS